MNNTTTIGASAPVLACMDIPSIVFAKGLALLLCTVHGICQSAKLFDKAPTWLLPGMNIAWSVVSMSVLFFYFPAYAETLSPQGLANVYTVQIYTAYYYAIAFHILMDRLENSNGWKKQGRRTWHYVSLAFTWVIVFSVVLVTAWPVCFNEDRKLDYSPTGIFELAIAHLALLALGLCGVGYVLIYTCNWWWRTMRSMEKRAKKSKRALKLGILKLSLVSVLATYASAFATVFTTPLLDYLLSPEWVYVMLFIRIADTGFSLYLSIVIFYRIVIRGVDKMKETSLVPKLNKTGTSALSCTKKSVSTMVSENSTADAIESNIICSEIGSKGCLDEQNLNLGVEKSRES